MNAAIVECLLSLKKDLAGEQILDVPCGRGEFLDTLKRFFPLARMVGADKVRYGTFAHEFLAFDAEFPTDLHAIDGCAVITCISGIMEFDNTLAFFRSLNRLSNDETRLIVTNDNLLTARDRLLYALFGRFCQYKSIPGSRGPTWKIIHLNNLERLLNAAGFQVKEVLYVVGNWTAWLWLPLAAPMYLAQLAYFLLAERDIPYSVKRRYHPFASTLARHYLFVCRKENEVETGDSAMERE